MPRSAPHVSTTSMSDLLTPPRPSGPPPLPRPRGPVSAHVLDHLARPPHEVPPAPALVDDPVDGDDAALALYTCYELHYRGFAGVCDEWEWEPSLVALVRGLERALYERLVERVGAPDPDTPVDVESQLYALLASGNGEVSLSSWMADECSLDQMREMAVHRSAYQLKEADPHTFALPRLTGAAKAAMVEIQADEYGDGVEVDMHQSLFAVTMRELGLDPRYGAYLDLLPGKTLATVNLVSFFGVNRRWRGACIGHLAVFEMTSVEPMGRYAAALRRLGLGPVARHFYEVHVVADAHHEAVAASGLAGNLAVQEPALAADIMFGARAISSVEATLSAHLFASWGAGQTSLLAPLPHRRPAALSSHLSAAAAQD